jgi:hypothetical protein
MSLRAQLMHTEVDESEDDQEEKLWVWDSWTNAKCCDQVRGIASDMLDPMYQSR